MKLRRDQPLVMPELLRKDDPAYALERYKPRQAAAYLGLSKATIYVEVAEQRLAHRRSSERGEILFSQADLDQWREVRRVPARMTARQVAAILREQAAPSIEPLRMPRRRMFG